MRNIFFRIYGGLTLATLLIAAALYAGFQSLNQYRLHDYLNNVAKGTFVLITQGIARHQGDTRQEWFEVVRRLTGLDLTLSTRVPADLSADQRIALAGGDIVITTVGDENRGTTLYIAVPGEESLFLNAGLVDVNEQLARVTALLILNELGRMPKEKRSGGLQRIGEEFGFALQLNRAAEVELDFAQRRRVRHGDIVVILKDATSSSPYIEVYSKFGNSGQMLVMGPIPLFSWYPREIIILFGVAGLLALALSSYALVRPLERRLKRMETEVEKIGTEEMPAVSVEGDDALSRFGEKVNNMAQRIQALLDDQRELTHAISHELLTPVSRIRFRLEEFDLAPDENSRRGTIAGIHQDLGELNQLISEILTYAGLEHEQQTRPRREVDIVEMISRLREEIAPLHPGIHIEIKVLPGNHRVSAIDPLLHRLLQNLVVNAAKYAQSQVVITFKNLNQGYQLRVSDDGPGIAEEDYDQIFAPFARLDKSRNRASGGFGLGLAIVSRIAGLHEGRMTVGKSEWGGAEFVFAWPKAQKPVSSTA